ncbi:MAG: O-acetylhomoserine aminocarboxypropyltransferase/cysteine synthase [Campylobacteraceae bacterium]|jgi:O-acetylhomoserine (thiol)-lyase|nr:O-acetylhomoserine aminocarboxypropyltransferase/cysteine synthase [Campylobacteraceae bacterium]MBT3882694.1 O-acetylhomoserine aminocarboxypropyltransferase/cysteine synthase [Campylobacteraceae bacterium]MBT4030420.1 O-acetylhomoserine aminocarboxypropyltransferase/cysteine synthase [Campylobacteraceae bacterium]MBT4178985.1 O-acetylhomoserine aminocarboxypropyltransferase/cysteine synthase [Campylobacteraceae bacterium]MBT4573016.1 O-acetylhomoserine aminocarboxypropyltransferase/cystein
MSNFDSAISTPISSSASFSYSSSKEAEDIFSGNCSKPLYSRMGNPTTTVLESKMTELENGIGAVATSSGMGAITMSIMSLCSSGDEVLAIGGLFGGSYALLSQTLPRYDIQTKFFDASDLKNLEKNITDKTKVIFCESVGNPNLRLVDLEAIGKIATKYNIAFIVDNTITPKIIQPLKSGADIVVYSTTKIISGNSSALGGIAVFREIKDKDKFKTSRYSFLNPFISKLGAKALIGASKKRILRDFGMSANANASYHTLLGLETLDLRNERVNKSCEIIASNIQKAGLNVNHPSLSVNCDNTLYKTNYKNGCGTIITIDMGTKEKAFKFLDNTKLLTLTANIGDSRTLALHMASTIYSDFKSEEKDFLGITDGLIRLSIGLEDPNDISKDLITSFLSVESV